MNVVATSLDSSCWCRFLLTLFLFSLKQVCFGLKLSRLTKELKLFFPVQQRKIKKSIIHHHCAILAPNKHSVGNRGENSWRVIQTRALLGSRVPEKLYHLSFAEARLDAISARLVRISRPIWPNFFWKAKASGFESNRDIISFFSSRDLSKVTRSSRQYTFLFKSLSLHFAQVAESLHAFSTNNSIFFSRFETNKSTKGASKLRRDLINAEIANLRDLLPLPQSTRQRLSQLQLMALVCVYVRKANYFQQGKYILINREARRSDREWWIMLERKENFCANVKAGEQSKSSRVWTSFNQA